MIQGCARTLCKSCVCKCLVGPGLFTGTVMENIRYGRLDATDDECIRAAKQANAHSFIKRLPRAYQTEITADGANLSQGQRQLLAIARRSHRRLLGLCGLHHFSRLAGDYHHFAAHIEILAAVCGY
jgi:ABC-type bacteriocin/lantibiotic exporter with double-glycine peptidase domain